LIAKGPFEGSDLCEVPRGSQWKTGSFLNVGQCNVPSPCALKMGGRGTVRKKRRTPCDQLICKMRSVSSKKFGRRVNDVWGGKNFRGLRKKFVAPQKSKNPAPKRQRRENRQKPKERQKTPSERLRRGKTAHRTNCKKKNIEYPSAREDRDMSNSIEGLTHRLGGWGGGGGVGGGGGGGGWVGRKSDGALVVKNSMRRSGEEVKPMVTRLGEKNGGKINFFQEKNLRLTAEGRGKGLKGW